jgi:hypothetical protein
MDTAENRKPRKKFPDFFRDNIQKIIIFLCCALYMSQGIFDVVKKEATIWDILGNIGISVIVGVLISSNLNSMGLKDGRKSEIFTTSMKAYGAAKQKATPLFDKLPAWCEYKNSWELEMKRKEIIQSNGLSWKAYKFGYYEKHTEKLNEKQKQALEKVKDCTVYRLTSQELLSDLPKSKLTNNRFGESEREFETRNFVYDLVSKIFMGVVLGLYGLEPLLTGENFREVLPGIIWNTMQILLWLALGLMKYSKARSFIEDEYRQTHIIQKTELLNEFMITMDKNPKVVEEFDEDEFINEYIDDYIKKNIKEKKDVTYEQKAILD